MVDAPRVGCVVRVPETMKLNETALGFTDARDHETWGGAVPAGAEAAGAEADAAAEPDGATEALAVGATEADAALFCRAKLACLASSWTLWAATTAERASGDSNASFIFCWK